MRALARAKVEAIGPVSREFRVEINIRNNRLKARRLALGLSAAALCRRLGLNNSVYGKYEACKGAPLTKRNGWNRYATTLAKFYRTTEEDLFPDVVLAVTKPDVVREIGAEEMAVFAAAPEPPQLPDAALMAAETASVVRNSLSGLTTKERDILRMRFGLDGGEEMTYVEIGQHFGVSSTRVAAIADVAMRKLRSKRTAESKKTADSLEQLMVCS